ncbi:hypothetical protein D3C87_1661550 [compost metagenome]
MTSLVVFRPFAVISATISSRLKVVQPQIPCLAPCWKLSPRTNCRICSTTGLQPPQERVAPVQALISSTVVKPFSVTASTMAFLVTPLQPQTISSSAIVSTDKPFLAPPPPQQPVPITSL